MLLHMLSDWPESCECKMCVNGRVTMGSFRALEMFYEN